MITRKAIAGFILLAMITFPTVYYATPSLGQTGISSKSIDLAGVKPNGSFFSGTKNIEYYRAPIIALNSPLERAIVVTAVLEVFTFLCYIVLKRLEPAINKAAERAMLKMREQNECDMENTQ